MSTYYEKARSNYFKVKDDAAFNNFIGNFPSIDLVVQEKTGQFCLLFDEDSGMPSYYFDEEGKEVEIDFVEQLSRHLTDDSIAVIIGVGSEKYRYLVGYSFAVNSKGEQVYVDLNEIYRRAEEKFGVKNISAAAY